MPLARRDFRIVTPFGDVLFDLKEAEAMVELPDLTEDAKDDIRFLIEEAEADFKNLRKEVTDLRKANQDLDKQLEDLKKRFEAASIPEAKLDEPSEKPDKKADD